MNYSRSPCRNHRGFTLTELMIVVAVIGVLLSAALPNFSTARTTSRAATCQMNLRSLCGSKEAYLLEARAQVLPAVDGDLSMLVPRYLRTFPQCPAGGTYRLRQAHETPTCSIGDAGTPDDDRDDHVLALETLPGSR